MKTKTKKLTYLTIGLMGALATSTVVGVALSSCTVTNSGTTSNDGVTLPDTWYSKDINWSDPSSLNNLLMDKQGIVYSNKYMTEIIAIAPGYNGSTITIPASVKVISGYNNITTSGNSTTKTPKGAFEGLSSITNVVFAGNDVTKIGKAAFKDCSLLQTINLPSNVISIGNNTFENCYSLNAINLDNVQYIGDYAFKNAFINIPYGSVSLNLNKTSSIGISAFEGALGIKSIDLSKNSILGSIGNSAFKGCAYLTGAFSITNDKYLINIGSSAFENCVGITNIYLPENTSLKTIGASAFSGCTSLVSIGVNGVNSGFIVPSSIRSIGATAFANTLISSIDLSQNTATNPLLASALKDMPELSSINLGTNITTLNSDVFANTPKLSEFDLVLPSSITTISASVGNINGINEFNRTSYSTFYNSGFRSIDLSKISSPLNEVGYGFFENCSNLQSVILKSTTTRIKFRAFYDCTSLKNVVFANSTNSNDFKANNGFVAPSTLTEIGSYAFSKSGIELVDLSAVTTNIMGTQDIPNNQNANYGRFANCLSLQSVKLPSTTTRIQSFSFDNNPKLDSFNFNDLPNLAIIDGNNFSNSNFSSIDLSSNTMLGKATLAYDNMFRNLSKNAKVSLPSSITEVKSNNFTYKKKNESGTETITTNLEFSYPNGIGNSSTSYSSPILAASSSNFSYLSRVSGELDFSNFSNLNGLGKNTLFGNSELTSLTFGARTFASGTIGNSSNNSYLGFVGENISDSSNQSDYVMGKLPFGNMSKLNKINFKNFTNSTTTISGENANILSKTTNDTWNQVVRIMNSFTKSSQSSSEENLQSKYLYNSETSTISNFSLWGELSNDISVDVGTDAEGIVNSVKFKKTGTQDVAGEELLSINYNDDLTVEKKFTHNSVEWKFNFDASTGSITISALGIDTYRLIKESSSNYPGSPNYKVFFNTKSETNNGTTSIVPNSDITVTLNVVLATATPSQSK